MHLTDQVSALTDFQGFRNISVSAKQETSVAVLIDAITARTGFQPEEDTFIARTPSRCNGIKAYLAKAHEQLTVYQAGELVAESLRLFEML